MPSTRKTCDKINPTSLKDFQDMLSSDCTFSVDGTDGDFAIERKKDTIEVSDIESAPESYCESFASVEDMIGKMLVGKLRYDDESKRVKVIDGVPLRDCWRKATVRRLR